MSFFYVIDDLRLLPPGRYAFRLLQQKEAVTELERAKIWSWYIKDKDERETYYRLREVLALNSGVVSDDFKDRELKDPQRLNVGTGHKFLLICDHHQRGEDNQPILSYHLFDAG